VNVLGGAEHRSDSVSTVARPPVRIEIDGEDAHTCPAKPVRDMSAESAEPVENHIDGFAGPQQADKPQMWAAKLVLESEPRWLRHFFLCDNSRAQYRRLVALKDSHVRDGSRRARSKSSTLTSTRRSTKSSSLHITEKEATFCLLDQRTFECRWATVEALARHKKRGYKIELFYFLPLAWLGRALAAQRTVSVPRSWWGRDDWRMLRHADAFQRGEMFCKRFKELGYRSVMHWPIFEDRNSPRLMYFMIHATDHPVAPKLMRRAVAIMVA
jgi:three-Cys-motif partner protein